MDEDLLTRFVEAALLARAEGRTVDLARICRERPELQPEVERLMRLELALDAGVDDGAGEPSSDPLVGQVLDDRYTLEVCIGIGAMGAVYRARDRSLQREVAVKLLQNGLFASAARRERFAREARVLAALRHPSIVGIHDHGCTEEGLHYLVMELIDGVPLAQVLQQAERIVGRERGPNLARLDAEWLQARFQFRMQGLGYLPQCVFWCSQVAAALVEAHRAGVAHRDVKPSNVLVDRSGAAILLDFGIAAKAGEGGLTEHGSTIGTPWYMAPEQVGSGDGDTVVRELVDVYGVCATLYHMVTLRPPYDGDYDSVLRQLASRDPLPPRRLTPELPRDLCAVIEKGMEREPSRRYASMADLHDDLQALCLQLPVKARAIRRPERWWRALRRRPGAVAGVLAVVLAIALSVPLTAWWRDDVHAAAAERSASYLAELAPLPPSVAFEGSLALRPLLDAAERRGFLQRLDRVLAIDPEDHFARLLRSGLLLDQGDHAPSTADIDVLLGGDDGAFARAFRQRYAAIDTSQPGVAGLDLDGLPEPVGELDRVVLGFQLYRRQQAEAALAVLEGARSRHAFNMRLQARFACATDQRQILVVLTEVDELERQQGGVTARSAYFRGKAHQAAGDTAAALAAFTESARLCPDAYGVRFNKALIHIDQDRLHDALRELEAARALRPANRNAAQQIASVLAELGRFDEALAEVERMPRTGHLAQPWHRDYVRGYVLALRAIRDYGEGRADDAVKAEQTALASFEAAARDLDPNSRDYEEIAENVQQLILLDKTPAERVDRLFERVSQYPGSATYLAAFTKACDDAAPLDAKRQLLMRKVLLQQAERLRQRTPIDDSTPK